MKVTILTCFESNEERALYLFDAFKDAGYDTEVITTDFSHIKKCRRNNVPDDFTVIETKKYTKNLSLQRMYSHYCFAKDAYKYIENNKPDVLWVMAPANSLIKETKTFKKNNRNIKVVIDIIDMWPESLPIRINKNIFPFSMWKNIRKNNIDCADILVSECNYYHDILSKEYKKDIKTLYLTRDNSNIHSENNTKEDVISLCYIGSINNIIDTDRICKVVSTIDKPVDIYVIGDGENKDYFLNSLSNVANVKYCGVIKDEDKKSEIFNMCHAGINVYKKGLYIGFTTKCLDYFENGLPIINSINGDTWDFVNDYDAGFNIDDNTILKADEIILKRKNNQDIFKLYENNFSKKVFIKNSLDILQEVIK